MRARRNVTLVMMLLAAFGLSATTLGRVNAYKLDASEPGKKIFGGHLKLGGTNPNGDKISFTNYYMEVNDKPVMPVMGEFHFSRYPQKYWEESILKMKAGGLDVVPSYVFWNIHEEEEGVFDWSGDRDVRRFVELCKKNNVWTIIRIGPFCHGEIRNGGLPDWLYGRPFQVRSNDPGYLKYVERLYKEIGKQLKGLMFKDGGPIIGIQLENEFQHSASPWSFSYPDQPYEWTAADMHEVLEGVGSRGADWTPKVYGIEHMKTLKRLAIEAGMIAPIYTATGWGGATIIPEESLPVMAAYAYPNWAPLEKSPFYRFKDIHKNPDYPPALYDAESYPAFCAEMSGGMMVRYARRPVVPAESLEALVVRTIGSGANAVGYYMYHGGSTPVGKHSFMSDETYGYPKISYDFQAPIREYGQLNKSFYNLKTLHLFLNEFGDVLAPMTTVLPVGADKIKPGDTETLRFAARVKDDSGFLFMMNFQDHSENKDIDNIQLEIKLPSGTIAFGKGEGFTLKKDTSVVFPFNFRMSDVLLKKATAQLLTKVNDTYFFYAVDGIGPEYVFDESTYAKKESSGNTITVTGKDGSKVKVVTLTRQQALAAWKTSLFGKERLFISDAAVIGGKDSLELISTGDAKMEFSVYPDIEERITSSAGKLNKKADGIFTNYRLTVPEKKIGMDVKRVGKNKAVVNFDGDALDGLNDIFVEIDYVGDSGMAFIDGKMINDNLYYGEPWQIGVKRFAPEILKKGMYFYFKPVHSSAEFLQDLPKGKMPDFSKGPILDIKSIRAVGEYKAVIKRKGWF